MRKILFRGKRIDGGEWIEGYYLRDVLTMPDELTHFIATPCGFSVLMFEVYPHTIGQFTGLTDKNGKKIFEGDILRSDYDDDDDDCGVAIEEVVWHNNGWCIKEKDYTPDWMSGAMTMIYSQVIGNIHDNPELLEAEHGTGG